jgi:hypothetical protein
MDYFESNLAASPDPRGDTIAIFSFDQSGKLELVNQVNILHS